MALPATHPAARIPLAGPMVIVNGAAKAATGDTARAAIRQAIARCISDASVSFAGPEVDVRELAQSAAQAGARLVVAAGGDGTVNAIASALRQTGTALGIIPLGTLNHFAKDLGIPLDLDAACTVLAAGYTTLVDVGDVNGRCFVNNSGLGLYPDIVHMRERRQRDGASKWPAAILAALHALLRFRMLGIRIVVDGASLLRRTPVVFVGNNEYAVEGLLEPRRATLSGGHLCLYVPHPHRRLKLVWFTLRALFSKPRPDGEFDKIFSDDFTIESKHRELRVSIDGEVTTMAPPLRYRSSPQSLRVVVPAPHA